ncbi:hypothetical protein FSOLCH5_001235 [Fusarium solani]
MVSIRSLATAVAGVALLIESSLAYSVKRNAVSQVTFVADAVIKTPSHRVHSDSKFDLHFSLHNGQQKIRLKLEPNHDILHDDFSVTYLDADGKVESVEPIKRSDHRVFKGDTFVERAGREGWTQAGWARITIYRDGEKPLFEGTLGLDGTHHHIQFGSHYEKVRHEGDPALPHSQNNDETMVVWRDSDIMSYDPNELKRDAASHALCDSDSLGFNGDFHELQDYNTFASTPAKNLFGRQSIDGGSTGNDGTGVNLMATIGSVDGCPTTRKVALLGIATDCGYTAEFDNQTALRENVINMVNTASRLYESTFSISLGLRNLTISNKGCPCAPSEAAPWNQKCSDSVNLAARLNLFSAWRGQYQDGNAYWTLLSTCPTESAVGLAWLGQLCRSGASDNSGGSGSGNETVAGANVVVRTSSEWQVFAHETGHTFGAVHDCTSSACPVKSDVQSCCPLSKSTCDANEQYIMNPSSKDSIKEFSPCTIGNICSGFKRNVKTECLTDNKGIKTITGSQCGNGIVEEGEDCDCGGDASCKDNPCCDGSKCKFKGEAECDYTNEDCCTKQCKFSSSGTVCRASTGPCDPEEKCTGKDANCPKDEHKDDGTDCGDGLKCASGQCTSRDQQCRTMWQNSTDEGEQMKACTSSCLLSCQYPGESVCTQRNQNFLDGTPCAGGGKCDNGDCKGSSTWKEIVGWFEDNKNITIPVGCVIAGLLAIAILSCCYSCIRRRISRRKAPKPTEMHAWPAYARGANPHTQPSYNYAPLDNQQNWGNNQQQNWGRTRSMRYA